VNAINAENNAALEAKQQEDIRLLEIFAKGGQGQVALCYDASKRRMLV
jgi:hypothetical protein